MEGFEMPKDVKLNSPDAQYKNFGKVPKEHQNVFTRGLLV